MKTVFTLIAAISAIASANYYSLAHIFPTDGHERAFVVQAGADIVHVYEDGSADAVLDTSAERWIRNSGIPVVIRMDNLQRFYEMQCSGKSMGGFMTWDEIQVWMDNLHATYPNITSPPTSIGDTYQGRPQLVMKIGTDNTFTNDDPARPNCWYDALIHAREGASMQNTCSFMEWLCSNYDRNGYCGLVATYVLENRDCWFLPCYNPDGWVYNESTHPGGGGMQRKNMNFTLGDGVDLNRNFSIGWGGSGSSGDPGSETYRGTGPLSESENINVDAFWAACPPIEMHNSHTYSDLLLFPWGFKDDPPTHMSVYQTHGEIMVQWGTGEVCGPVATTIYIASGGSVDHSYELYGAMSWSYEIGFTSFWPSLEEVTRLTRRNLRGFLVTALLAGCPLDPHVPEVPVLEPIGIVGNDFSVEWSSVPAASSYGLQEITEYDLIVDDHGDSGPFVLSNWSMSSAQFHSGTQSYHSNGSGTMTWDSSVAIPADGGGRISFWCYYNIGNGYEEGSFEYSPNGGSDWYYLQTFCRNDPTWRRSIHELDEWQGETLMFRWHTQGGCDMFVDDIMLEAWDGNEFVDLSIFGTNYDFVGHPSGDYWFRAMALDPDFGWSWASEVEEAHIATGIAEEEGPCISQVTSLGCATPNPARGHAIFAVELTEADAQFAEIMIYDLSGRIVAELSMGDLGSGNHEVLWDCRDKSGHSVPAGTYVCRLSSPGATRNRMLVVLK